MKKHIQTRISMYVGYVDYSLTMEGSWEAICPESIPEKHSSMESREMHIGLNKWKE